VKAPDATTGLTPLHEAQRIVLDAATSLGLEKISILDTLGRVLGEDIIAERHNPPWDNSAMDGFAVRAEDIQQEHTICQAGHVDGDRGCAGRKDAHQDPWGGAKPSGS
jgi:molybdopterin molybdotransferase